MIPPLTIELGYSKQYGALVVTVAAVCEFFTRLAILPLTGYFNINIYKFLNLSLLSCISGLVTVSLGSSTALMVHGVIHGLCGLYFAPLITVLIKVSIVVSQSTQLYI